MANSGHILHQLGARPKLFTPEVLLAAEKFISEEETEKLKGFEAHLWALTDNISPPLVMAVIIKLVKLNIDFPHIYNFLFSLGDSRTYKSILEESDIDIIKYSAVISYQKSQLSTERSLIDSGFISHVQKFAGKPKVLSIFCGNATEIKALAQHAPKALYTGMDPSERQIAATKNIYPAVNENKMPKKYEMIAMDRQNLAKHPHIKNKKWDYIILRNPEYNDFSLSILVNLLPIVCHPDTMIYLSSYSSSHIKFFCKFFGIDFDAEKITKQAASQNLFVPQPDTFHIFFPAKQLLIGLTKISEEKIINYIAEARVVLDEKFFDKLLHEIDDFIEELCDKKFMDVIRNAIPKKAFGKALRNAALMSDAYILERILFFRDRELQRGNFVDFLLEASSAGLTSLDYAKMNTTKARAILIEKLEKKGARIPREIKVKIALENLLAPRFPLPPPAAEELEHSYRRTVKNTRV